MTLKLLKPKLPMLKATLPRLKISVENPDWAERQRLYNTARWRSARKRFLKQHPLCVACGVIATVVDHALGHDDHWRESFWDSGQWQSMCGPCHSRKTNREERGLGRPKSERTRSDCPTPKPWDGSC